MRAREPNPTRGSEDSTVQIDVEEMKMDVDGVSLRVYDCAGQVKVLWYRSDRAGIAHVTTADGKHTLKFAGWQRFALCIVVGVRAYLKRDSFGVMFADNSKIATARCCVRRGEQVVIVARYRSSTN